MRQLPRRLWRVERGFQPPGGRHLGRGREDRTCGQIDGPHGRAHHAHEAGNGFHAVGLHQPRHALDPAQVAEHRRGVFSDGLPAEPGRRGARELHAVGQEHRRGAGPHAQPQWHDDPACHVARQRVQGQQSAGRKKHGLHERLRARAQGRFVPAGFCAQCPRQPGRAKQAGGCTARCGHDPARRQASWCLR